MGQCGVASENAVYGDFDLSKDTMTEDQLADEGGIISHKTALYFGRTGLPHGYISVGLTRQDTMVAMDEVYTMNKTPAYTSKLIKKVHPGGSILADHYHSLRRDFRTEKLRMRRAKTDRDLGVPRFRNIIAEGNFKVLVDHRRNIACPHLRNELESHEFGDRHEPQPENCSLIIPMEYIACSMRETIDPALFKRLELQTVLDMEPASMGAAGILMP